MKKTALTIAALAICFTVTAGAVANAQSEDLKEFSTRDLERALKETNKELKTFRNLEKKFDSAARQSSNTARKSAINDIQDHMGKCILRREDNLGLEHTIKMHGGHVVAGTTDAADVGAPVGTSRAKRSLDYVEGIEGYLLRQLSRLQSIFIAAMNNKQPAIEKQGDSLERYAGFTRRFREELERNVMILEGELANRAAAQEQAKAEEY
jgi:hypothetical protein